MLGSLLRAALGRSKAERSWWQVGAHLPGSGGSPPRHTVPQGSDIAGSAPGPSRSSCLMRCRRHIQGNGHRERCAPGLIGRGTRGETPWTESWSFCSLEASPWWQFVLILPLHQSSRSAHLSRIHPLVSSPMAHPVQISFHCSFLPGLLVSVRATTVPNPVHPHRALHGRFQSSCPTTSVPLLRSPFMAPSFT